MSEKLKDTQIMEQLNEVDGWNLVEDKIEKEFELKDFSAVIGFVTRVGIEAEKADHHPDILVHSWNKVKIFLSTHDAGGLTEKDFLLARVIDSL